MSGKIKLEAVAEVLKRNELEPGILRAIIEELSMLANPEGEEGKPPAVKKQFAILVSDPAGVLTGRDFAGWVLQLPENEAVQTAEERIVRSAHAFNCTKRGRLMPVQTIGEACDHIPSGFFRESQVWVKTKTPVLVLRTSNEIKDTPGLEGVR